MPKTNIEFWKDKFDKNVLRDKRKSSELESSGWRVIVVWECEISKDHLKKIDQITKALKGNKRMSQSSYEWRYLKSGPMMVSADQMANLSTTPNWIKMNYLLENRFRIHVTKFLRTMPNL